MYLREENVGVSFAQLYPPIYSIKNMLQMTQNMFVVFGMYVPCCPTQTWNELHVYVHSC